MTPSMTAISSMTPSSVKLSRARRSLSSVFTLAATVFSQSCRHASSTFSELSSSYVVVHGPIVSIHLNSAFTKHFCTVSFMPCHHDAAIITAILSEPSFSAAGNAWHQSRNKGKWTRCTAFCCTNEMGQVSIPESMLGSIMELLLLPVKAAAWL